MPIDTLFDTVDPKAPATGRMLVDVWGREKLGKSHFLLTFPAPLYIFNFDLNLDTLLPKFAGKEIRKIDLHPGLDVSLDRAKLLYDKFEKGMKAVVAEATSGTIAIDGGTQLWQLIQTITLGEIKKTRKSGEVYPFDYADGNTYFSNILNFVKTSSPTMNFVISHRAREKYNGKDASGTYEEQGNSAVPYLVQTVIKLDADYTSTPTRKFFTVEACTVNEAIEGLRMPREKLSYEFLRQLAYPGLPGVTS